LAESDRQAAPAATAVPAIAAVSTVVAVSTISATQDSGLTAPSLQFSAKEIDGQVYIKADALVDALGGNGYYDPDTGTYAYRGENRIAQVVKDTSPSVVAIIGKPVDSRSSKSAGNRFNLAHGTGIVIKSDGWIVTNAHVVKDMDNIVVVTYDGKQYAGHAELTDEESDLALVKIDAEDLPEAKFADQADVEVGETVVAIGTPISFALRNSVTVGVISGTDRSIHSTYRLLQTDAAINPGNSGGALVNLKGEIIGINSLKFAAVGVDNLGFAIPAETVEYVLRQYFEYGEVRRPSLGFELEESWAAIVGLPSNEPLKVTRVKEQAEQEGIQVGDELYSINDVNVNTLVDLNENLKKYAPGDTVKVMLQSAGDLVERDITLIEQK
jgi:serine protease Do